MFFRYDDEWDFAREKAKRSEKAPRVIGGERVETFPAPQTLVEHYRMEQLFNESEDAFLDRLNAAGADDSDEPLTCEAVVSARLIPSKLKMVEIIELSGGIDDTAKPYDELMWLKVRRSNLAFFIAYVMVCVAVGIATLFLAVQVSQWWQMGALVIFMITTYGIIWQFILKNVIRVSDWYRMPYSSWRELVKCMSLWDNQGVSHGHIYRRAMSFIEDVAVKDWAPRGPVIKDGK